MKYTPDEMYALLYDASLFDWHGEIEFYQSYAREAKEKGQGILEIACGTGRVALQLAREGAAVTGLDISEAMLEVAREKSDGVSNVRWVRGDMRGFDLGEKFGLVTIPGHPFQVLLNAEDQVACLECIKRHLLPDGMLIVHLDHQNLSWLGSLPKKAGEVFEKSRDLVHPKTGRSISTSYSWAYEPATQTASLVTLWEETGDHGEVIERWERGPIRLHCVFRFEMEHLLSRAGFEAEAVFGDFLRNELRDDSSEMIWVVRHTQEDEE